jgi:hypothetical protein
MEGYQMDRIRKISYKGKEIIYIDFSNLNSINEVSTILDILHSVPSTLASLPENSALTLTNVEGTFFNREVLTEFKDNQTKIKPYLKKAAVIGIHGLQKIAYDAVAAISMDHNMKNFNTEIAAKDWLVE